MYNFVDTIQASEGVMLPSEAMLFNGEYIENQISGYRTLNVSGREALSPELTTYETGARDGARLHARRFPERTIIVTYQLIAESNEAFREAYNRLGSILNVEDAQMIFNDEPDKYFIGTPSLIGEVEPGTNAVVGQIEILCVDPFKYSVVEYEATTSLDENSVLISYNGTYKAFPTLEADFYKESEVAEDGETSNALTGNGDCGFVAFFTEDEKIIQLGDPDEIDGTNTYQKSQTLMNQLFTGQHAWGTTAQALWDVNGAEGLPTEVEQIGDVGMVIASYATPANPASTSGTLIKTTSDAGAPKFNYTVTAKTSGRTENTVRVAVTITASLGNSDSYFGRGYGLTASVYINGAWRSVKLKDASEYWRGRTGHTVNTSFVLTGLNASTAAFTGIKFKVDRSDSVGGSAGIVAEKACSNLAVSPYVAETPDTYCLTATDYGTANSKWHGAAITRAVPADAAGEVGASDFTLTYKQKMCIGDSQNAVAQMGAFQVQLVDSSGANVAGVRIHKNKSGTWASLLYYVNGVKVYGTTTSLAYNNKAFGSSESAVQTSTITKSGGKVTFSIGGIKQTFTDDTITDTKVAHVTFVFENYSDATPLAYNGLYWAKFVKNNCNTLKEIPNKFSANDVVEADCKSGEIRLNGVLSPELGALGNDWEEFTLTPGLNQIGISYSNWLTGEYVPTFKVRYREVFL